MLAKNQLGFQLLGIRRVQLLKTKHEETVIEHQEGACQDQANESNFWASGGWITGPSMYINVGEMQLQCMQFDAVINSSVMQT